MIRVLMLGRTGNNLFQYALGRVLAEKHGVPLILDGSWFQARDWEMVGKLEALPIKAKLVRPWSHGSRLLRKVTGRHHWEYLGKPVYREPVSDLSFNASVLSLPADCVAIGYFQSPRYFETMEEEIRGELSFSARRFDETSMAVAGRLMEPGSVAVHVRRTDYIGNPNVDVCGDSYYRSAARRFREQIPSPRFFIFSDDPGWCAGAFRDPDCTVVDCPESRTDPFNDLHLMSLANHHIIANSSYSWWGAWLGKKKGQQVLMPPRWFEGIHSPIEEKMCEGWQIVNPGE